MPIRSSSVSEIDQLITDLQQESKIRRDAAVARLRIVGSRSIPRLTAIIQSDNTATVRVAALSALETSNDSRARDSAMAALSDKHEPVALAAIIVMKSWLSTDADAMTVDALVTLVLDPNRSQTVRQAALQALADLPESLVQPLRQQLTQELGIKNVTAETTEITNNPARALEWLNTEGANTTLSEIHQLITYARAKEHACESSAEQAAWCYLRGAAHVLLAKRNSRVALYDLRESIEKTSKPLPLDYLLAIRSIGDATCLEPLGRAWAGASAEPWWCQQLADAAKNIISREKLTGRHAVVKRARARWAGFLS
tara:strand:- start:134 stop:1072 length:939 start_codon:yes stop_codon:yes gene_type:complete